MIQVNVLVMCYNQATYIAQAMEGLIMQRVADDIAVSVLIADDASTDDTLSIIQRYEKQSPYPFTYLPSMPNMGHVRNYERAFKACAGEYVCILEGDDYWCSPMHIQRHIDFLDMHRECVLSSSRPYVYDGFTKQYCESYYPADKGDTWFITAQEEAAGNKITNLSTCVLRNSTLQKVIQDTRLWEVEMLDWLLELSLAEHGLLAKHRTSTSVYRCYTTGLWSGLEKAEQRALLSRQVEQYDRFFEGRYAQAFAQLKAHYTPTRPTLRQRLKQYCPPIILAIIKLICPPILYKNHTS